VLEINPAYQEFLRDHGLEGFEDFWQAGELFKAKKNRAIYRLSLGGQELFLKKYFAFPLWQKGEALNEWEAAKSLLRCHFKVPQPVALGVRRRGLKKEAFTLFFRAPGVRLEDLFKEKYLEISQTIVPELALFAARFHACGFSHQDFYLCHIFWDEKDFILIDLQRLRHRRRPPLSWLVKDVAQLFYSARQVLGRDFQTFAGRFKEVYAAEVGRELGGNFWRKVERKVSRIARHDAKLKARRKFKFYA